VKGGAKAVPFQTEFVFGHGKAGPSTSLRSEITIEQDLSGVEKTAGPSTALRFGRDDKSEGGSSLKLDCKVGDCGSPADFHHLGWAAGPSTLKRGFYSESKEECRTYGAGNHRWD
jgi:hypothetical protein